MKQHKILAPWLGDSFDLKIGLASTAEGEGAAFTGAFKQQAAREWVLEPYFSF